MAKAPGFTFFESFHEATKDMPDTEFANYWKPVLKYIFEGETPEFTGLNKAIFALMKPNIDSSLKNRENGKKGGRQKSEDEDVSEEPDKGVLRGVKRGLVRGLASNKDKDKEKNMEMEVDNTLCSPAANSEGKNNGTHNAEMREVDVTAEKVFEKLWELYPMKRGKSKVSEANKRRILDIGLDEMIRAVERYKADLAKETWRKPQNGSTFFSGGYVDYLDSNYTAPPPERAETKKNGFNNFVGRTWDFDEILKDNEARRENNA